MNNVSLGFVITSHGDPGQLLRLVAGLNDFYGTPPIACHHDFAQTPLDVRAFPPNVRFVEPSIRTSWGTWSVVRANLAGLALLYRDDGPDWFVTLSAADYPVRAPRLVLAELGDAGCDAFVDVHAQRPRDGSAATIVGTFNPLLDHLESDQQRALKSSFYERLQLWVPRLRRQPRWRVGRWTIRLPIHGRFYRDEQRLFWGEAWFSGTRKVARLLLAPTPMHRRLQRYLRWRTFPEESYVQTVLANSAGLTLNRDNKRFTSWQGGAHPVEIGDAELAEALASGAHFARKFRNGSPLLDRVDAILARGQPADQP